MRLVTTRRGLLGGAALAGAAALSWKYSVSDGGYDAALAEMTRPLPAPADIVELLRYATLAANGHNTQPWRFRVGDHRVDILPDFSRRTPIVDPDDHHLYASLGCAAETLKHCRALARHVRRGWL